jgi:hypothetical protein
MELWKRRGQTKSMEMEAARKQHGIVAIQQEQWTMGREAAHPDPAMRIKGGEKFCGKIVKYQYMNLKNLKIFGGTGIDVIFGQGEKYEKKL